VAPDAIYLSHIHWDHFHGPSLRLFNADTRIVIPYERSTRMSRDLTDMGFRNIVELKHGQSLALAEDFTITSYQFSLWGDSAIVIHGGGVCVLNANDAKFMGGPLEQIIARHAPFDFVFRSHSSANDRACYESVDAGERQDQEDPAVYARSFFNFIEKTKPRYAVPFASNHCHLHKEVFAFNDKIETPLHVQRYVTARGGFALSTLKLMASGDSWESGRGFDVKSAPYFEDRDAHLRRYLGEHRDTLERTYAQEERTAVSLQEVERFFSRFLRSVPHIHRRFFKGKPIVLCAKSGKNRRYFLVDVFTGSVTAVTEEGVGADSICYETAAAILKKAMALNMFSHVGISKRVRYRSKSEDRRYLVRLNLLLAAYEYEVLPLGRLFSWRTCCVCARRWREVLLAIRFFLGRRSGRTPHELEERFLR
jgi:UDP-MurNAc hydroxylase